MSRLISQTTSTARASAVVSAAQLLAALLGGLFALLVALIIGEGDQTDGFLAAYSAYLLLLLFGSTMRVSLVPLLGDPDDPGFEALARKRLSELLPLAALTGLLFVAVAPLLGRVLLSGGSEEAKHAAVVSVAILGVAAFGQVWAALLAAVLAAGRRFVASALIFLAGSIVMVALASALMELDGATGAAIGVAASALLVAVAHTVYLARLGFAVLPTPSALAHRETWKLAVKVAGGAVLPMTMQLMLTISVGFVSGATGLVSGYIYAYLATVMATGVTAQTIGLVTLPGLLKSIAEQGRRAGEEYLREMAAFGVFLFLPIALGFVCFGRPVVDAVLGGSLSPSTIDYFWDAARLFMTMGVVWCVLIPFSTLALAMRRFGTLTAVSVAVIPLHTLLAAVASPSGPIWTAVAHAISGVLLFALLAAALFGADTFRVTWRTFVSVLPAALLGLVFVLPRELLGAPTEVVGSLAVILACTAIYVCLGVRFWPRVGGRMFDLLFPRGAGT